MLFNGKDLEGWRAYRKASVKSWKAEDGMLVNSDTNEDIITREKYSSFDLKLEWKVAPGSNSGIFFHVEELDDAETVYATGPEYQLLDDLAFRGKLKDSQYSGANYDMEAPAAHPVKAAGEWNRTRLLVNGAHVEHWLNGVKVLDYELGSARWKEQLQNSKWKDYPYYGQAGTGHIALQDHGGTAMFRNIKVKAL